jgi:hypothetical protein
MCYYIKMVIPQIGKYQTIYATCWLDGSMLKAWTRASSSYVSIKCNNYLKLRLGTSSPISELLSADLHPSCPSKLIFELPIFLRPCFHSFFIMNKKVVAKYSYRFKFFSSIRDAPPCVGSMIS